MAVQWPISKKIYLAGKIDQDDWRIEIVEGLSDAIAELDLATRSDAYTEWPTLKGSIFGCCDYVGPFFSGSPSHPHDWQPGYHGMARECGSYHRDTTVSYCLDAIKHCDLFFAWISRLDCFGTLVELGYAKAWEKPVVLAFPPRPKVHPWASIWFARQAATERLRDCPNAKVALEQAVRQMGWLESFESPLEFELWMACSKFWSKPCLVTQYCPLPGIRVDFAHVASKTAFECDWITYHGHKFEEDRARDRAMAAAGWLTVRFSGDQVRSDPDKCAQEVFTIIERRTNGQNAAAQA